MNSRNDLLKPNLSLLNGHWKPCLTNVFRGLNGTRLCREKT